MNGLLGGVIEALQANTVIVGIIVGSITPLLTSLVQQPTWAKNVRVAVSVVVSAVVGTVLAVADGQITNAGEALPVILAVWTSAEAFYQKMWKNAGITDAIERASSPSVGVSDTSVEGERVAF